MRVELGHRGSLAHYMMKATSGVQANYAYGDERDAAQKLRVAIVASPVVTALYANSCISEGSANGFLTRRAWIWRHTDPDRCGLLPFVFEPDWSEGGAYARYVDWALDIPMLFIQREHRHLSVGGQTFRAFLQKGYGEHRASLADWNMHLTTLFPEVRLKRVIEVRGADAVPPGLVCALPALWKGLFYDAETLSAAEDRLRHWSFSQVDRLHADVTRDGLQAATPDGPALGVAQELVDLAAKGLGRIGARNESGEDESRFLEPLYEIIDRGVCPARHLLAQWDGSWGRRIERLIEYAAY
jgi:glutamate--cysteine ligase